MSDSELQLLHPPRRCGDGSHCNGAILRARELKEAIDQSYGALGGVVYECTACTWKDVVPMRDAQPVLSGWTASVSPCRRHNDVQPR